MIGWNFPLGEQRQGVSGMDVQFKGEPLKSLAREICQNSLDAAINENTTVFLEFEKHKIDVRDIPGYADYKEAVIKCRDYWSDQDKSYFFRDAVQQLNKDKIFVLRISDYNTVGLNEPYNKNSKESWNALTIIDGGATKSGDAGGSYGMGKMAPFANSSLRLVFYRTLNQSGERAAQGIARLPSFPKDISKDFMTVGIGYYGDLNKNLPLKAILNLEIIKPRVKVGTDVFIYGFISGDSWKDAICVEILENFLISIYNNKLEVRVGDIVINKKNIGDRIRQYKLKNAYNYYRILTEPINEFIKPFKHYGIQKTEQFKLQVLTDQSENLNRKLLVIRKSGMKLFDDQKYNIPHSISFTGILSLEGKKLNEYFRDMEPPTHDAWQPERLRLDEQKEAKRHIKDLKDWIFESIYSLGEKSTGDEFAVEGLSSNLQIDTNTLKNKSDDKKEILTDRLESIEIEEVVSKSSSNKKLFFNGLGDEGANFEETNGIITNDGKYAAVRTHKGKKKPKRKEIHRGIETDDGQEIIKKPIGNSIKLKNVRIIKIGSKSYRIIFESSRALSKGDIEIMTVGENGKSNTLNIVNANSLQLCDSAYVSNGKIAFENLSTGGKVQIEFMLQDEAEYAMEVNIYENK